MGALDNLLAGHVASTGTTPSAKPALLAPSGARPQASLAPKVQSAQGALASQTAKVKANFMSQNTKKPSGKLDSLLNTSATIQKGGNANDGFDFSFNPLTLVSEISQNVPTVNAILQTLDVPRAYVASAINQTANALDFNDTKGFDLSQLVDDARAHKGIGTYYQEQLDHSAERHGGKAQLFGMHVDPKANDLVSRWSKRAVGLAGDVAADPLTYVSGGVTGGAEEAVQKGLGTADRVELAKTIASLAEKGVPEATDEAIATVARKGATGLSPELQKILGVRPTFTVRGVPIPGSEPLAAGIRTLTGKAREIAGDTIVGRAARAIGTKESERKLLEEAVSGSSKAATAVRALDAVDHMKGISRRFGSQQGKDLTSVLKSMSKDELRNLPHQLETGVVDGASGRARTWLDNVFVEGNKLGANLAKVEDYYPHALTPDAAEAMAKEGVLKGRAPGAAVGPELLRKYKAGETFMGTTLETGSSAEINQVAKAKLGYDLFSTKAEEVLPHYLQAVQSAVGRGSYANRLVAHGVGKKLGAVERFAKTETPAADGLASRAAEQEAGARLIPNTTGGSWHKLANDLHAAHPDMDVYSHGTLPEVQKALEGLPPVEPGKVRLYRGGTANDLTGVASKEWEKRFGGVDETAGRYFTDSPIAAMSYTAPKRSAPTPGDLFYVDVPRAEWDRLRNARQWPAIDDFKQAILDRHTVSPTEHANIVATMDMGSHVADPAELAASIDNTAQAAAVAAPASVVGVAAATKTQEAKDLLTQYATSPDPQIRANATLEAAAKNAEARMDLAGDTLTQQEMSDFLHSKHGPVVMSEQIGQGFKEISKGVAAPQWLAEARQVEKALTPQGYKAFLAVYDRFTALWKAAATFSPGFHVRNAYSGVFNNFVAGVHAGAYKAYMVLRHKAEQGTLTGSEFTLWDNIEKAVEATGNPFDPAEIGKAGTMPTHNKILTAPARASRAAGNSVENHLRGAMALDSFRRGEEMTTAISRINRFHFNYADISNFDRAAKRIIPFWMFTSRNLPLQLQMIIRRPGAYTKFLSLQRNLSLGLTPDSVVPSYFGEQGAIQTDLPLPGGEGTKYLALDLPFLRVNKDLSQLTDPIRLLSNANPLIKAPIEAVAGKRLYNNVPFNDKLQDVPWYMDLPGVKQALIGLGVQQQGADGHAKATDQMMSALESLLPLAGRLRRLAPSEDAYQERQGTSIASTLGLGSLTNTPSAQAGELARRKRALEAFVKEQQQLGFYPAAKATTAKPKPFGK